MGNACLAGSGKATDQEEDDVYALKKKPTLARRINNMPNMPVEEKEDSDGEDNPKVEEVETSYIDKISKIKN
jgi:hypothetical protein